MLNVEQCFHSIGSPPPTSSPSMTLTYLLFFMTPLAVAPTLTSPLLFSLSPYLAPGRCFRTCVLITTNSTNRPSSSGLSPQRTSPFFEFSESSSRWLCFFPLTLTVLPQRNTRLFFFLCCCSLYFSDTECPPYNLVLWTNGSVPFSFGKDDSGVLANCFLCGIEATLFFSAGPVCSSIFAETCAILHALCWSRQHQQICHFSSPPI